MSDIDPELLQQDWLHSHEEDTGSEMVFRPSTFDFPPSRGRAGFSLEPNGQLVETGIGPADGPQTRKGTWELKQGDDLEIQAGDHSEVLRVLSVDKDRLVIKR